MPIQRREFLSVLGTVGAVGLAGCTALGEDTTSDDAPGIAGETLRLTTTTSTYDTGLLDELNAAFETRYGVSVQVVEQGTGGALETARNGDADVVMVHARSLEDEFLEDGYGVNRRDLMFNDFVVAGASEDPAGVAESEDVTVAFTEIRDGEATFVSRGDGSGTHTKELAIWEEAGIDPGGEWYQEAGHGMGEVLVQADQQGAYTLADRGTYLSMNGQLDLEIHLEGPIEGGPELLANPYGIVAVDPAVHEHVEYDLAMAYIGYLTGVEGQTVIEEFTVDGEQLFFPESLAEDPNFEQYVPEAWNGGEDDDPV